VDLIIVWNSAVNTFPEFVVIVVVVVVVVIFVVSWMLVSGVLHSFPFQVSGLQLLCIVHYTLHTVRY
jgi:hypothetical protein